MVESETREKKKKKTQEKRPVGITFLCRSVTVLLCLPLLSPRRDALPFLCSLDQLSSSLPLPTCIHFPAINQQTALHQATLGPAGTVLLQNQNHLINNGLHCIPLQSHLATLGHSHWTPERCKRALLTLPKLVFVLVPQSAMLTGSLTWALPFCMSHH